MERAQPRPMEFARAGPLRGAARIPGDKSISHRALIIAAMAAGRSRIEGLNEGADVAATAAALRAMGVGIESRGGGASVDGVGAGALRQPEAPLEMGNSGSSARLIAGLVASHPIEAAIVGDESLSRRPMERVAAPLRRIGAEVATGPDGRMPLHVRGLAPALPRGHRLEVASAQVKTALLLAALNIPGVTEIAERAPTRDHGERLLAWFGAPIDRSGLTVRLAGEAELKPRDLAVPGDPSAAAFLAAAALVVPGSEVRIEGVCANPLRTGFYRILESMGGRLEWENERMVSGEPVADLTVRHSRLKGVDVPPELAPATIDEYPALFVAAAFAQGRTRAAGLAELRLKESDRIAAMAAGLAAIGVPVRERAEGLELEGSGGAPLPGGAAIAAAMDHRVAMSFAVAGLHSAEPIMVDDMASVDTSFPGFAAALAELAR